VRNVLFALYNRHTFGLFEEFAIELRNNGFTPLIIDLSKVRYGKADVELESILRDSCFQNIRYDDRYPDRKERIFDLCEWIFSSYKIDLLVVPFETKLIEVIVLYAKELGVPSLHVQHALWDPGKFSSGPKRNTEFIADNQKSPRRLVNYAKDFKKNFRNKVLTDSETRRKIFEDQKKVKKLINRTEPNTARFTLATNYIAVPTLFYKKLVLDEVPSYPEKNILVTGFLRNNIFSHCDSINLHERFNVDQQWPIVSYFYTPLHTYPKQFIESYSSLSALIDFINCCNLSLNAEKIFYLVLIHPRRISYVSETINRLRKEGIDNYLVTTSGNCQGAIYKQSLLVGGAHTTALSEARSLNCRVIKQDYILKNITPSVQNTLEGITIVKHPEDLCRGIDRLLNSPPQLKCELVDNVFGKTFQRSSQVLFSQLIEKNVIRSQNTLTKNVLFLLYNQNSFGLFEDFSKELERNNYTSLLLELSHFKFGKTNSEWLDQSDTSSFLTIQYNPEEFVGRNRDYKMCKWIFDQYSFDLVVVPFELSILQIFVAMAQENNIPTLHIQHSLWSAGKFGTNYNKNVDVNSTIASKAKTKFVTLAKRVKYRAQKSSRNDTGLCSTSAGFTEELSPSLKAFRTRQLAIKQKSNRFPLNCDYFSVASGLYRDMVLEEVNAFPKDRILVTGYQRSGLTTKGNESDLFDRYKIDRSKTLISYFYTPLHTFPKEYSESYPSLEALADFVRDCSSVLPSKELFFLVLIHPTRVQFLEETIARLDQENIEYLVSTSNNNQGQIYRQSLVVGGVETAALAEARMVNTRVIRQNYVLRNMEPDIQTIFNGIAIVERKEDLKSAIKQLIDSPPDLQCELVTRVFGERQSQRSAASQLYDSLVQKEVLVEYVK
jgi:hypothetical protein